MKKYILSVLVVALFCSSALGQIRYLDIPRPPSSVPLKDHASWKLQRAIDMAATAVQRPGRTATVDCRVDYYDADRRRYVLRNINLTKEIKVPSSVVLYGGEGRRSTRLVWLKSNTGKLLTFTGGFGGGISGIDITCNDPDVDGLAIESSSSCVFENFSVRNVNRGIVVSRGPNFNTESVLFSKFNVIADRPIVMQSGDNITFEHFDITGLSDDHAIISNENAYVPANLAIKNGSAQKGSHLLRFEGLRERMRGTGDVLSLRDIRYEQTTGDVAIKIRVDRYREGDPEWLPIHSIESVTIDGCRISPRGGDYQAYDIEGVLSLNVSGGYLPGIKRYQRNLIRQGPIAIDDDGSSQQ